MLISGELKPNKGKVLLNGKDISGRKIGFISQSHAMFADTQHYNLTLYADFPETKIHDAVVRAELGS